MIGFSFNVSEYVGENTIKQYIFWKLEETNDMVTFMVMDLIVQLSKH